MFLYSHVYIYNRKKRKQKVVVVYRTLTIGQRLHPIFAYCTSASNKTVQASRLRAIYIKSAKPKQNSIES